MKINGIKAGALFYFIVSLEKTMAASRRRVLCVENDQVQIQVTLNLRLHHSNVHFMCLPNHIRDPRPFTNQQLMDQCIFFPTDNFVGLVDFYYFFMQLVVPIDLYNTNRFFIMIEYYGGFRCWYDVKSDAYII